MLQFTGLNKLNRVRHLKNNSAQQINNVPSLYLYSTDYYDTKLQFQIFE